MSSSVRSRKDGVNAPNVLIHNKPAHRPPAPATDESPAFPVDHVRPTSIEREIRELNAELRILQRKCAARTVRIGRLLLELKENTEYGKWESYVENQLGIPPRTASRYMNLWKRVQTVAGIGEIFSSAKLAELSVTDLEDWLDRLEGGEVPKREKAQSQPKAKPPVESMLLSLADGSEVDLKRLGWKEGLLSRQKLENCLRQTKHADGDVKQRARFERVVLRVAASVNLACGKADRTTALRVVDAAFSTIRDLLEESE